MRVVGVDHFGGPEVLEVFDRPVPEPGPGEVRIRVAAATVNPTDTLFRAGARAAMLEQFTPPWIPGMELGGVIDALGDGAPGTVGDAVMSFCMPMRAEGGAYAEYVVVPAEWVTPLPAGVSAVEAATIPMNGLTVHLALETLGLEPGQTLGVTGAAGAVGGYAIQMAKAAGLWVVADASPADEAGVRALGADVVVPRGPDVGAAMRDATEGGVDGLIDAALLGDAALDAVRDGGTVILVREIPVTPVRGITVTPIYVSQHPDLARGLTDLARLAESGALTLRVAQTYAPEQAADAHRRLEAGGTRGRLVITF